MFQNVYKQLVNVLNDKEDPIAIWNLANQGKKNRSDKFEEFEDSI